MVMRWLNRLLPPKEDAFFTCFEQSAEACYQAAKLLFELTRTQADESFFMALRELKRHNNHATQKALAKLHHTLITPIDREDIQNILLLLHKTMRTIVKSAALLNTYQITVCPKNLQQQVGTLFEGCKELKTAVERFRSFKKTEALSESNVHMGHIESQGDDMMHQAISDLFSGKHDPLTVVKLQDVHKHIERALDLCARVSESLVYIALKHT